HGQHDQRQPAVATARSVLSRYHTRIPDPVDLAPGRPGPAAVPRRVALDDTAFGPHPLGHDLVLWRFPGGALRNRPRIYDGLPRQASAAGTDRAGVPESPSTIAPGRAAGGGGGRAAAPDATARLDQRRLGRARRRRQRRGLPARRRAGTTTRPGD